MPLRIVLPVGETRVDAVSTGLPPCIQGDESNLEIGFFLLAGKDPPHSFLTGFLGAFPLPHQLDDKETPDCTHHLFPQSGGGCAPTSGST